VSIFSQLKALVIRDLQLKIQDRLGLAFGWATAITISIIIGSIYLNTPKTAAGAFTRFAFLLSIPPLSLSTSDVLHGLLCYPGVV
jgi:hypothetical protein